MKNQNMAGTTRLELATFGVTGRRSKPAELRPRGNKRSCYMVGGEGLEPPTSCL